MNIKVSQQKFKWNFKYCIEVDTGESYFAEASRTILPTKRRVSIKDGYGNVLIELLEKNMLRKFLWSLPFIGIVAAFLYKEICAYDIIQKDKNTGSLARIRDYSQPRLEAHIGEQTITVYEFSLGMKGIKYSVYCDGTQVGLVEKNPITSFNADKYLAQFDSNTDVLSNILIAVAIDLAFHTNDVNTEISSAETSYEWNLLQGRAKTKYDENWKPN
jgi:hypothetical protein